MNSGFYSLFYRAVPFSDETCSSSGAFEAGHFFYTELKSTSVSFPGGSEVKASACNVGDPGSIPGCENGNPLQYSCLENPMDRGAW